MLIRQLLAIPGNAALATLALACALVSVAFFRNAFRAARSYARMRRGLRT
jgi:ABC-type multidrug transport system permease subunit